MILQLQLRAIETMTVHTFAQLHSAGLLIAMDPGSLPTRYDPKENGIVTSVSSGNDCAAGDLHNDRSTMRVLMAIRMSYI